MELINTIQDDMNGTNTYKLDDGRWITLDRRLIRDYGLTNILKEYGIEPPTKRLPVVQYGKIIGTMAPDFDPYNIKSNLFWYDGRPGDFVLKDGQWIASRTLGASDVDCVVGFIRTKA